MSRNALVVGINSYRHLNPLSAPAEDAEAIAKRLKEYGDFSVKRFPEIITDGEIRQATVAKKTKVSIDNLEDEIRKLFLPDGEQPPDTALLYFSGHGLQSGDKFHKGFLCASDTNPDSRRSGLSLGWLQSVLEESPIKQQIVWLDCCHSGSLLVDVGAANPGHGESRDRCYIASSRDFEESWQDLNSPYSVLTKALLDGLDPTRLPDGEIDTFSLADFVNKAMKGELQSPVCTNFGAAIHLTRSLQSQTPVEPRPISESDICPYKGLEYFDCNDTDPKFFFGRDRLVSQLLDKVRTSNFLALVGASGNGKSSVLRAGLLHQLKLGQRISGSEQWRIRLTRPDDKPMENLALAFVEEGLSDLDRAEALGRAGGLLKEGSAGLVRLIQASSTPKTILVIDQFEEAFTRCSDLEEREQYFECLIGALPQTQDKVCLIITMRGDFTVRCMEREYSGLARWIDQHQVSVLPMLPKEIEEAIFKPAQKADLEVEPTLITEIQDDIAKAPGGLPLLQFTLKTLWQKRSNNLLTFKSYQDLGLIEGALNQRATEIYESFEPDVKTTVRHIFIQLTQLGEGAEDTRRRVFQKDLVSEPLYPQERVQHVIDKLSSPKNRLLVTSEIKSKGDTADRMAIVDVAHEALIRHWKLLRTWIEDNRDLLRKQRKIEASAIAWREQGKRNGDLLQRLGLAEASRFNKNESANFPLSDSAKSFIRISQKKQFRDRLKTLSWLLIPALIISGVVEYNLRESSIKLDFARLDQEGTYEEKIAVQALVKGCFHNKLPSYLSDRLFGNCRSLSRAPLQKVDLRDADLSSANFQDANLQDANLDGVNLQDANLSNANLSGANLSGAKLYRTNLSGANPSNANLRDADLSNADLSTANLSTANFSGANLDGVNLSNANLSTANLSGANLYSANLRDANLSGANLDGANLRDVNLDGANLSGANLYRVNLYRANLYRANLRDANLIAANLIAANLSGANLYRANLRDASLSNANLSVSRATDFGSIAVDLRDADFQDADLISADLRGADLSNANLQDANLQDADLSGTDLQDANLDGANLRDAIFLSTDLRNIKGFIDQKLQVETVFICNSPLPSDFKIDRNRDCDQIAKLLQNRYVSEFIDLKAAQQYVEQEQARQMLEKSHCPPIWEGQGECAIKSHPLAPSEQGFW